MSYFGFFLLNRTSEKCHTQQLQTDHTHSCRHTMPCAAASRCKAVPDHTSGPPDFTNYPRKVCVKYLHGTCGVADPLGESEMHRVCHTCLISHGRETSGADTAGGFSLGCGWVGGEVGPWARVVEEVWVGSTAIPHGHNIQSESTSKNCITRHHDFFPAPCYQVSGTCGGDIARQQVEQSELARGRDVM